MIKPRKYQVNYIDFNRVNTYPISKRENKVTIEGFSNLESFKQNNNIEVLFPALLKGSEIKEVISSVVSSFRKDQPIIFAMGAHVIKCGLSPIIIDLINIGIVKGIALNGAGAIHDYEIAMIGQTSEDVGKEIKNGRFGMVEETGDMMNKALAFKLKDRGLGEIWGEDILKNDLKYKDYSILANAYKNNIPVTIHVAIGTDIIHMHPNFNPALIGEGSYNDFKLFCSMLAGLDKGGCYFNIGSSVVLPEVFLKAVSIIRNLGIQLKDITTVNMDMIQHYRPTLNVITRPLLEEGKGYNFIGHHEILLPLIYTLILSRLQE